MAILLSSLGGGGVKSVQRGSTSKPSATVVETISEVDLNKSFLNVTGNTYNGLGYTASGRLTSSTEITFNSDSPQNASSIIYWEVIEYE